LKTLIPCPGYACFFVCDGSATNKKVDTETQKTEKIVNKRKRSFAIGVSRYARGVIHSQASSIPNGTHLAINAAELEHFLMITQQSMRVECRHGRGDGQAQGRHGAVRMLCAHQLHGRYIHPGCRLCMSYGAA
jgi:hypothetical protein